MTEQVENRSRVRIRSRFWVAVEGEDEFPRLRDGNISASGIYFTVEHHIGDVGSVQWLYLSASEQEEPLGVMCRVVRALNLHTLGHGSRQAGVALQFMPQDDETREGLKQLVRHVALRSEQEQPAPMTPWPVAPTASSEPEVRRVLVETSWDLREGDVMRVELQPPGARIPVPFEGQVSRVIEVSGSPMSRAEVQITALAEPALHGAQWQPASSATAEAVHLILGEEPLETDIRAPQQEHITGQLSRIHLPGLLTFVELERLSGELEMTRGEESALLYLGEGRLLDAEAIPAQPDPRAVLQRVLSWPDGAFELRVGPVDRADRLGTSITALLIDLARTLD